MGNYEVAAVMPAPPSPPPRFTLFGKLPAELRCMIWHCALGSDEPVHIHVGILCRRKPVDHWCCAPEGSALCRDEARARAGEAPHPRESLVYAADGFFFAPEKPARELLPQELAAPELGPEHGGDQGGFHYHVGAACHEARQAFLKRFPQTMAMYKDRHRRILGRYGPYRLVRFNGALDVLVARHWMLRPIVPRDKMPPRPTFASFRAALTSFRHLAFVATEQIILSAAAVSAARNLYRFAESVERLSVGLVPHWRRLPDGAVHFDDVNALSADSIHIAHAQMAARRLAYLSPRPGARIPYHETLWQPVDAGPDPDLWVLRPRPMPLTIGCYV